MRQRWPFSCLFVKLFVLLCCGLLLLISCTQTKPSDIGMSSDILKEESNSTAAQAKTRAVSQAFKDYWYDGQAEITSYNLEQARYGELRNGTAALIFVTEDFLPDIQVKADNQNETNISVLKLNATKKFTTGIYPYSVMTSTFDPVALEHHALKVSQSTQEWCGHVYTQLNNRDTFEIWGHSYFEKEADRQLSIEKAFLENEIWTQLRIDPNALPTGEISIIPDLAYLGMKHLPIKAYRATAILTNETYTLNYPELNRSLVITYEQAFPFGILGWEERFSSGFGSKAQILTTKATAIKTIKSPYWSKNSNADSNLRNTLGLE